MPPTRTVLKVWLVALRIEGISPPFGKASTIWAANSSSQKSVLRPVLPSLSCEVRTIINSAFRLRPPRQAQDLAVPVAPRVAKRVISDGCHSLARCGARVTSRVVKLGKLQVYHAERERAR